MSHCNQASTSLLSMSQAPIVLGMIGVPAPRSLVYRKAGRDKQTCCLDNAALNSWKYLHIIRNQDIHL
jgi:hypothetical protein